MRKYQLKDKVVVITGSTGGLGQATARALREKGAKLALLDLDLNRVERQANELGGSQVAAGYFLSGRFCPLPFKYALYLKQGRCLGLM